MLAQQQNDIPKHLRMLMRLHEIIPAWAQGCFVCMAFIAGVLCVHGRSWQDAAKCAWSRWEVQRAASLLEDEVTAQEGVRILRDALVRTPNEPEVIRSLAQLTTHAGMLMHARFFYQHLQRCGVMTPNDALQYAAVTAGLNDHFGAQIMLQAIWQQQGETPDLWRTQATAAAIRGDHAAARSALSKVLTAVPNDENATLGLAKAEALSPEVKRQHEGIDHLLDLLEASRQDRDPTRRNTCLWTLSSMTLDDAAQRTRFASLIHDVAWQKVERLVLQRFLEWTVDSTDTERKHLLADLTTLLAAHAGADLTERLSVAKMLQRHGEHSLVLDWISMPIALKDPALSAARLDSLLALQQWLAASNLIENEESPLPPALRSILRAQLELLSTSGSSPIGDQLLTNALQHARKADHQPALIALARLASEFGRHGISFQAYAEAMSPQHPHADFITPALVQEARHGGATASEVLHALEKRSSSESWNQESQRQLAYYRLLCGESIELVESHAQSWQRSQDPQAVLVAAFLRYRMGYRADIQSFMPLLLQPHAWSAGERAALHAISHSAGDRAAASNFRQTIPANAKLFTEEKELLSLRREGM